jgi:SAM-dependent methyltransferase
MRYLPLGAQRRALAEIFRVLRPGGLAVITFAPKYSSNLYPLVNQVSGRVRLGGLTKVRQYFHSSRQVEQLLTDAGFAQVVVEARFFGPFVLAYRISPAAGRRLLRRWERWDRVLASTKRAANLANVFVAVARKPL